MTDETPPSTSRVGGAAADPRVREQAGLPPLGTVPPAPEVPGSLAASMHKAATGGQIKKPAGLAPNTPTRLSEGKTIVHNFPKIQPLLEFPEITATLPGGQLKIRSESSQYQAKVTSKGGYGWAHLRGQPTGAIIISFLEYEILVDTDHNVYTQKEDVFPSSDQSTLERAKELAPELAVEIQEVIGRKQAENDAYEANHQANQKAAIAKESQPIYLQIGRADNIGSNGSSGIAFKPLTDRDNPNIALLVPEVSGDPAMTETAIGPEGIGIPMEGGAGLESMSRNHLLIKIDGAEVTLVDGNGVEPSRHGTMLEFNEGKIH